jgi:predicted amidophosphoribosyltransferase
VGGGEDDPVQAWRQLLSLLAPPRCAGCGAVCSAGAALCSGCERSLASLATPPAVLCPPAVDRAWSAVAHEGVARELVVGLKFWRLLALAELMARRIAATAPAELLTGAVVPVPPSQSRLRRRGFDPAEEIAGALATLTGLPYAPCLVRADGPEQVGRTRAARLASPPRVGPRRPAPDTALLVDDVQTTGATLSACARALRKAGAGRVCAVTFARTL